MFLKIDVYFLFLILMLTGCTSNNVVSPSLAFMDRSKKGVEIIDVFENIKHINESSTKSGEQENANVQYIIGTQFENGQGALLDYTQAVAWYEKAAEQGHINAQYNLGRM